MRRGTIPALPIALALTALMALLPARVLRSLEDVAAIVNIPLTPLRDGANALADWLRPPRSPGDLVEEGASIEALDRDRLEWRRLYHAAALRIEELEAQLEQIQQLPIADFAVEVTPVTARVTGRNPRSSARSVELNRGSRDGIREGAIGVYNGVYLIGQITQVSTVRSVLVPITSSASGLVRGRVLKGEVPLEQAPVVQLRPAGDGTFTAEAASDRDVRAGDVVVVDDSTWPSTAQAMIIGTVESLEPKDGQPLRNVLRIRPPFLLHGLSSVTLVVERERGAPGEPPAVAEGQSP